jgi:hypothetical protein
VQMVVTIGDCDVCHADLPFDEAGALEPPDDVCTSSSRVYYRCVLPLQRSVFIYATTSLMAFSPTSTLATKFI